MPITKCPGHMRSLKLNFSATVLTLGLKALGLKDFVKRKFWGELRTRPPFDCCETQVFVSPFRWIRVTEALGTRLAKPGKRPWERGWRLAKEEKSPG